MPINATPIGGPAAWTRSTLRERDWLHPIDQPLTGAQPEFHIPALTLLAKRAKAALEEGPGLVVIRGWPVEGWSEEQIDLLCYTFGSLIGTQRAQKTGLVTTGANQPRRGMDNQGLAFHTDRGGPPGPPHLVGLLCLRAAVRGGESLLVSGHAVHDRLLDERPDLLPELYEDFRFGAGTVSDFDRVYPVFRRHAGRVRVQYNRYWIERGQEAAQKPLSPSAVAALDAFDEVLADQDMVLRLLLRPGDLLLVNNDVVLHGRTAFTEDPRARRRLARIWLD
ncbi:TauD/TfdA family dioxygenase [Nonomuraea sp. NEAU-A123]|uniref:TauD/TfdA family dioxygenase n=1 Tax=Nonomuraea sp. NEAU-A123 TaxID=2839649 RepID=UPI001BE3D319|nr:TauD/TfdA family dioxygenase [Nonomuraea sp. NEAU-A123]MBT2233873.1 TauD/TfdA family dioxygenase [Nonomuraea sp. NEAU-A123]